MKCHTIMITLWGESHVGTVGYKVKVKEHSTTQQFQDRVECKDKNRSYFIVFEASVIKILCICLHCTSDTDLFLEHRENQGKIVVNYILLPQISANQCCLWFLLTVFLQETCFVVFVLENLKSATINRPFDTLILCSEFVFESSVIWSTERLMQIMEF